MNETFVFLIFSMHLFFKKLCFYGIFVSLFYDAFSSRFCCYEGENEDVFDGIDTVGYMISSGFQPEKFFLKQVTVSKEEKKGVYLLGMTQNNISYPFVTRIIVKENKENKKKLTDKQYESFLCYFLYAKANDDCIIESLLFNGTDLQHHCDASVCQSPCVIERFSSFLKENFSNMYPVKEFFVPDACLTSACFSFKGKKMEDFVTNNPLVFYCLTLLLHEGGFDKKRYVGLFSLLHSRISLLKKQISLITPYYVEKLLAPYQAIIQHSDLSEAQSFNSQKSKMSLRGMRNAQGRTMHSITIKKNEYDSELLGRKLGQIDEGEKVILSLIPDRSIFSYSLDSVVSQCSLLSYRLMPLSTVDLYLMQNSESTYTLYFGAHNTIALALSPFVFTEHHFFKKNEIVQLFMGYGFSFIREKRGIVDSKDIATVFLTIFDTLSAESHSDSQKSGNLFSLGSLCIFPQRTLFTITTQGPFGFVSEVSNKILTSVVDRIYGYFGKKHTRESDYPVFINTVVSEEFDKKKIACRGKKLLFSNTLCSVTSPIVRDLEEKLPPFFESPFYASNFYQNNFCQIQERASEIYSSIGDKREENFNESEEKKK